MNTKRKLIMNLSILAFLLLITPTLLDASLTPLSAFRRSEKASNYGPSTIVKVQKLDRGMLYLCNYDKWYSANVVIKGSSGLFWYPFTGVYGVENDLNDPINYVWDSDDYFLIKRSFGIVNDPKIKSVRLVIMMEGETKNIDQELYDNMFLFVWEKELAGYREVRIMGLDKNSNIVYEKELPEDSFKFYKKDPWDYY
jgi:hypothetical protein